VLINLITNASDAMNQQSGIITLTTGLVEADASDFEACPGPGNCAAVLRVL